MKFVTMLGDTLRSFVRPPMTEKYPFVRAKSPEALRGKLNWNPEKCTGCCLCVKDCPADAIEFITIDKASKRFVVRYHADRCTFCAQCAESCRFSCIDMSDEEWELAALSKEPFTIYYGNEADVESVLAKAKLAGISEQPNQPAQPDQPVAEASPQPAARARTRR